MYNRKDLDLGERREESDPFVFNPSPRECLLIWTMWSQSDPMPDAVQHVLWEAWSTYISNSEAISLMIGPLRHPVLQVHAMELVEAVRGVRHLWELCVVETVRSMAADEHPMLTDYVMENYGDQIPDDVPWGRH